MVFWADIYICRSLFSSGEVMSESEDKFEKAAQYFKDNKYVILDSVFPEDQCAELTAYMIDLVNKSKTTKDAQCPLSEAIYGDPVMDAVLEDLRPVMEKATGLQLIPTYSYARVYLPGDELKPHLDRPACEISATLTLGFKGDVWPIHVSRDETVENDIGEILMKPGDVVAYRGLEINHWREPYTQGEWQCQVFLHYVDANGPHKDQKYDRRKSLGTSSKTREIAENLATNYAWSFGVNPFNKYLHITKENIIGGPHIDSILMYTKDKLDYAKVGLGDVGKVDRSIRNVSHCWLPPEKFEWLYCLIENEIKDANWFNYKFNLHAMEQIDFLEYHAGSEDHEHGKYSQHVDGTLNTTRKLTFSILLSDPSEFEGGDLLLYEDSNRPTMMPKKQGAITFFPSYLLHEVTPVTKGTRRALVSWIHGPHFT